jgi:hypothetical protein
VLALGLGASIAACSQDLAVSEFSELPAGGAGAGAPSSAATGAGGYGGSTAGAAGSALRAGTAGQSSGGRIGDDAGGAGGGAEDGESGGAGSSSAAGGAPWQGGAGQGGAGSPQAGSSGSGGSAGKAGSGGGGANGGASGGQGTSGVAGEAGTGGDGAPPELPLLLFSEYVEGSGTYKALEIHAPLGARLEGCSVKVYFNGNLTPSSTLALSGELLPGAVTVLCTAALSALVPLACDQTRNLTFNGDDAITLECRGQILDVIGQIGVDPGAYWGGAVSRTADRTLRRLCTVSSGDDDGFDAFDPIEQWQAFPIDTFDGLGTVDCAPAP